MIGDLPEMVRADELVEGDVIAAGAGRIGTVNHVGLGPAGVALTVRDGCGYGPSPYGQTMPVPADALMLLLWRDPTQGVYRPEWLAAIEPQEGRRGD